MLTVKETLALTERQLWLSPFCPNPEAEVRFNRQEATPNKPVHADRGAFLFRETSWP